MEVSELIDIPPFLQNIYTPEHLANILKIPKSLLLDTASNIESFYRPFDQKDIIKNKWRHIDNPIDPLKKIQRRIYQKLLGKITLPTSFSSGIKGKSVIDHASPHIFKPEIVTLDIKSCFPSTSSKKVYPVFRDYLKYSHSVANLLTKLTTYSYYLPQGSPVSTCLLNFVLLPVYIDFYNICNKHDLIFTLYVDDLAISGKRASQYTYKFKNTLKKYGYKTSNQKEKKMPSNESQIITGFVVNKKLTIPRRKIKKIRSQLFTLVKNPYIITKNDLISLKSKISIVKYINPNRARSLEELYYRYFTSGNALEDAPLVVKKRKIRKNCPDKRNCMVKTNPKL